MMAESSLVRMALRLRGQLQFRFEYRGHLIARRKYTLSNVKNRGGAFWLLLGAAIFAVNGTVSKLVLTNGLSGWRLAQIRAVGAAAILVTYMFLTRRDEMRVKIREIPYLLIYGAVGIALVNVGYFLGIARMHISITLIIEFTAPVWVTLWARFVQRKTVPNSMWLAIAVSILGLALIAQVWQGLTLDGFGLVASFGSAFALAAYLLIGEQIQGRHSAGAMLTWGLIGAALFWLLAIPFWNFPRAIFSTQIDLQGKLAGTYVPGWTLVLWVIVMGTIAPYICVVNGLRRTSAAVAGVLSMSEALIAGVIAWFWLDETWNVIQLIGGVFVVLGIILADRKKTTQSPLVA